MTIVEFFDKDHIENIVSTLLFCPEKVIFVGRNRESMEISVNNYRNALKSGFCVGAKKTGDIKTAFSCKVIPQNDFMGIVSALNEIVLDEGECCFDLTGGEDLYLAAVGALFERCKDSVQLHRFNISNGCLTDVDANQKSSVLGGISLSIEQLITIYNGSVTGSAAALTEYDEALWKHICALWKSCKKDNARWNSRVNLLARLSSMGKTADPLVISVDRAEFLRVTGENAGDMVNFIDLLLQKGVLSSFDTGKKSGVPKIKFKDELNRELVMKSGSLLELYIAAAACVPKNGQPVYSDIRSGVVINWNAGDESVLTSNEIDVILMKGITPVFISCKNGDVPQDELFKFSAVARLFGGHHAKKVLAAANCSRKSSTGLIQRAEEMGITVLDHEQLVNPQNLASLLHKL